MSANFDCEGARREIERAIVEGGDAPFDHCPECAAFAARTETAIRAVRAAPVEVPADLAFRTQFRVSLRARELRERPHGWALWVSLALSWVVGIGSAPWVWRAFEWLGRTADIPAPAVKALFGLWWIAPAAIAAGMWAFEKQKVEEE